MIRGLYTSALGMGVLRIRQEATANNLANANTIGYKKDTVIAKSFPEMVIHQLQGSQPGKNNSPYVGTLGTGVQLVDIFTDHSRGTQRQSSSSQSLAIKGEGYLAVSTPQGERYTRNGEIYTDSQGRLTTADGYGVMGQKGEITVKGEYFLTEDGRIFVNNEEIDRLKIVGFNSPLTKEGSTLFQGENPQDLENPQVVQSFLEESNVSSIEEMNNLIAITRSYEANQKVIQTQDSALEKAVTQIGSVS